jgi:Tfp pilus assembly protein PilV
MKPLRHQALIRGPRRPASALRRLALGVALIEALVALAVIGFGMLAVVGGIATLRHNGDVSRQRTEALRIAQDRLEEWRGYSVLAATANRMAYADIVDRAAFEVSGANATFNVELFVNEDTAVAGTRQPQHKHVLIKVTWKDRADQSQEVRLSTTIAGVDPDLRAVGMAPPAGLPSRWVHGRRPGVPPDARQISQGRSVLVPAGQPLGNRVALVFNGVSGKVTRCVTAAQDTASVNVDDLTPANCSADIYLMLSGYIRFYLSGTVASSNAAAQTLSNAFEAGGVTPSVSVVRTAPYAGTDTCFTNTTNNIVEYVCPVNTYETGYWAGKLVLAGFSIADDVLSTNRRVCRFFGLPLVDGELAFDTNDNLTNRNLVVIRAGNGTTANTCNMPTRTPRVWPHQPG